jgi:hypothetical protein
MMQVGISSDGASHVFFMVHGSVQVRVFDVDHHEFCIGSGRNAVEETLGCGDVGGGSTNVSYALDEVAADGELNAFGFGLLWSYFGNDA